MGDRGVVFGSFECEECGETTAVLDAFDKIRCASCLGRNIEFICREEKKR